MLMYLLTVDDKISSLKNSALNTVTEKFVAIIHTYLIMLANTHVALNDTK